MVTYRSSATSHRSNCARCGNLAGPADEFSCKNFDCKDRGAFLPMQRNRQEAVAGNESRLHRPSSIQMRSGAGTWQKSGTGTKWRSRSSIHVCQACLSSSRLNSKRGITLPDLAETKKSRVLTFRLVQIFRTVRISNPAYLSRLHTPREMPSVFTTPRAMPPARPTSSRAGDRRGA